MKAAVMRAWHAPLAIEEVSVDEPGPGEVLVRTVASGICHSDLHVIDASLPVPPPYILGHEPAGIVEAVGAGVTDVAPGDRVIGCLTQWCGVCRFCTEGRPYLCLTQFAGRPDGARPRLADASGQPLGQFANLSSFAERMLVPERTLVKIRDDMPKYVDFYLDGRLDLDAMISSRIPLDDVNAAFDRMRRGDAARQVIVFE